MSKVRTISFLFVVRELTAGLSHKASSHPQHLGRPIVRVRAVHELVAISVAVWLAGIPRARARLYGASRSYTSSKRLVCLFQKRLIVLIVIHRLNRPYFEEQTQIVLRKPDMADLCAYYANPKHPASGFWILEYGDTFVGLVAVDASSDDQATISHFYVDEPYRAAHAQNDLLSYAVKHAFTSSHAVKAVVAEHVAVRDYLCRALDAAAFLPIEKVKARVGVFKWKVGMRRLNRNVWEKRVQ